ncbi:MAG: nuclear transport factor 2 family protein [Chloroflexota bacterium]
MTIDYAAGGELLERFADAWSTHDGDAFVGLFADDAEFHPDPFGAPLVGHNAIRAYLLERSRDEDQAEFTVEQHWVSGSTVLAAWHASVVRSGGARVRLAGFLTMELGGNDRIVRLREWQLERPSPTG